MLRIISNFFKIEKYELKNYFLYSFYADFSFDVSIFNSTKKKAFSSIIVDKKSKNCDTICNMLDLTLEKVKTSRAYIYKHCLPLVHSAKYNACYDFPDIFLTPLSIFSDEVKNILSSDNIEDYKISPMVIYNAEYKSSISEVDNHPIFIGAFPMIGTLSRITKSPMYKMHNAKFILIDFPTISIPWFDINKDFYRLENVFNEHYSCFYIFAKKMIYISAEILNILPIYEYLIQTSDSNVSKCLSIYREVSLTEGLTNNEFIRNEIRFIGSDMELKNNSFRRLFFPNKRKNLFQLDALPKNVRVEKNELIMTMNPI